MEILAFKLDYSDLCSYRFLVKEVNASLECLSYLQF
jgi:hypothetical protein